MLDKTKEALLLYIKRADELEKGGFVKYFRDKSPIGLRFSDKGDGTFSNEVLGPDDDATKAMVATFRPFIQEKPISFRSIASLCNDPGLSENWKEQITNIRTGVNTYLDSGPGILIGQGETFPTRSKILDIYINGNILHIDKNKRKIYERWHSENIFGLFITTEFNAILVNICNAIFQIAAITKAELAK